MSKFYTNIEQRGDSILYMGWENGLPVKQKIKYKPHVFIPSKTETDYKAFSNKKHLQRVDFDSISDMKEYIKTYSDVSNFEIYGCSNIVRQFTRTMFEGEIEWDYAQTKIWFFDIETRVEGLALDPTESQYIRIGHETFQKTYQDLMLMLEDSVSFDLLEDGEYVPIKASKAYRAGFPDPQKAEQEILLISMIEHHTKKLYVWSIKPIREDNKIFEMGADFRSFESEKKMLKDFLLFWKSTRIDVISGWNSESFDIPYLVNRMNSVLGSELTNHLSPWNVIKERKYVSDNGEDVSTYDIYGITHLDYLIIYKKFNPGSKESFKLDYIAEYELGERKVENPTDNFKDFYISHWETFVEYNCVDAMLLHKLEHKMLMVRLAMQLAFIARCNFGDVVSAMRLWESIIYNYFMDEKLIEDYDREKKEKKQIVGAYVHEPKPGKYGWTVSLDFSSLYPSIMMQNNISPETIVGKKDYFVDDILSGKFVDDVEEGTILSANGLVTRKDVDGFIPILIKRMFDLRKKTKNLMLEKKKKQQEIKNRLTELGVSVE